jgi:rRNA small subunit pseudouridine methyltransferase Nep1
MAERSFVLVLAETALETIPAELGKHPAVKADAERRGKPAGEILLDRSLHHAAMLKLEDGESRGRPGIAYHVLLDVTSSPVYLSGLLDLYMHTRGDLMLNFSKGLRPPRSYDRFRSLMEQLLREGRVGGEADLITLRKASFKELVMEAEPSAVIGLSKLGKRATLTEVVSSARGTRPCFVVGGFPSGHFAEDLERRFDSMVSIGPQGLDASLVVCRLVYEMERTLGLE